MLRMSVSFSHVPMSNSVRVFVDNQDENCCQNIEKCTIVFQSFIDAFCRSEDEKNNGQLEEIKETKQQKADTAK